MSGHDELQQGHKRKHDQATHAVIEAAAPQEKESKAIKDIDKQTEEKWQAILKQHTYRGMSRWEVRGHEALALDAPRRWLMCFRLLAQKTVGQIIIP